MKAITIWTSLFILLGACAPTTDVRTPVEAPDYLALLRAVAPSSAEVLSSVQTEHGIKSRTVAMAPLHLGADEGVVFTAEEIEIDVAVNDGEVTGQILYAYFYSDWAERQSGTLAFEYQWQNEQWVRTQAKLVSLPENRGNVQGTVRSLITGAPLLNATVWFYHESGESSIAVLTDSEGEFSIPSAPAGSGNLHAYLAEYQNLIVGATVVAGRSNDAGDLKLIPVHQPAINKGVVQGRLAYRDACISGADVPMSRIVIQGTTLGPWLFLVDEDGKPISEMTTTDAAGNFKLNGLVAGTYRLQVRAESLSHFWDGNPRADYTIAISSQMATNGGTVDLEQICVDNNRPNIHSASAVWSAFSMSGDAKAPLRLERNAESAALTLAGTSPEGHTLSATWGADTGVLAEVDAVVRWSWQNTTSSAALRLDVTDGFGGHASMLVPVIFHAQRIDPIGYGGWQDFGDAVSRSTVMIEGQGQGSMVEGEAGITALLPQGSASHRVELHNPLAHAASETLISYSTTVLAESLLGNNGVGIGLTAGARNFTLQIENVGTDAYISLAGDGVVTKRAIVNPFHDGAVLDIGLSLEPATGTLRASVASATGTHTLAVRLAAVQSGDVRGYLLAANYPAAGLSSGGTFTFEGMGIAPALQRLSLPFAAVEHDGRLFDELLSPSLRAGGTHLLSLADGRLTSGADAVLGSVMSEGFSRAVLTTVEGAEVTVYTDGPEEALGLFFPDAILESWESTVAVSLGAGKGVLF